jgi:hypothetical protein
MKVVRGPGFPPALRPDWRTARKPLLKTYCTMALWPMRLAR